ncbi:MAG TPA: STAS domain-containing protein [Candidatus Ozemobacteraceae bacterium]|nr:STAS domain-containing protein [Candidatus Ozemobacteraceae bacterium]
MTENAFSFVISGDIYIVRPAGYLNGETCERLRLFLLEAVDRGSRKVLIDLAGVTVINSPGITKLLEVAEDLSATHKAALGFVGVSDLYRDVFQVTGLSGLSTIFDSETQAAEEL